MKNIQTISTLDLATVVGGIMRVTTGDAAKDAANDAANRRGISLCSDFAVKDKLQACLSAAQKPIYATHEVGVSVPGGVAQPR